MVAAPVLDPRSRVCILGDLIARAPAYVPECAITEGSSARALLTILARSVEIQGAAENGMPDRAQLGFLGALGNCLLPAQSARTPLVFRLLPNAPLDVTLLANSQVAAKLSPPPPSLLDGAGAPPPAPVFSTEETVTLTRADLVAVYSVDPEADTYADHTSALTTGFTLFGNTGPVPHHIYLGHDSLFAITSNAQIELAFDLAPAHSQTTPRPLLVDWAYLSADGWLPLRVVADQTARLTQDGRITLRLDCGPDAAEGPVDGIKSYWVRGAVSARVPSGHIGPLPGGYPIAWGASPTIKSILVTIAGTVAPNNARIVKSLRATITLDRSLSGTAIGATVVEVGSNAFVGRIRALVGGVTLVLDGVDPGRAVTIDGTSTATVLAELHGAAALDRPLGGLAVAAALRDAATGDPIGAVAGFEPGFTVPLDSAADFLPGDLVTVDTTTRAAVTKVGATAVTLANPIGATVQGGQLVLADALAVLRPEGTGASGVLPSIDVIRTRVGFTKTDLLPDAAAMDTAPLNLANAFHPFGRQPERFATFYLASKEVFARPGAQVDIVVRLAQPGAAFDDAD